MIYIVDPGQLRSVVNCITMTEALAVPRAPDGAVYRSSAAGLVLERFDGARWVPVTEAPQKVIDASGDGVYGL